MSSTPSNDAEHGGGPAISVRDAILAGVPGAAIGEVIGTVPGGLNEMNEPSAGTIDGQSTHCDCWWDGAACCWCSGETTTNECSESPGQGAPCPARGGWTNHGTDGDHHQTESDEAGTMSRADIADVGEDLA